METRNASARLRKAFRYPEDDSMEPEAMDEQEQEQIIKDLEKQNDESNDSWLKVLLVFNGICFIVFIWLFVEAFYSTKVRVMCVLAITSSALTVYCLLFIPTSGPKMALYPKQNLSPAQRFLPYLNGLLGLLIGLNGLNFRDRMTAPEGFWIFSWLPLVVFGTILLARRMLVEVNPDELWDLKYDLKGA